MSEFKFRKCSFCSELKYKRAPFTLSHFGDGKVAVFICQICGMTPIFSTYTSQYEKVMRKNYYKDKIYSAKGDQTGYEKLVEIRLNTISDVKDLKGKTLFDIGCGEGILLDLAKQKGAEPTGLEPDSSVVRQLTKKGLNVFEGLLEDFPIDSSKKFDIVTLTWTIDAMIDPFAELCRVRKLIKSDGVLHISISSHFMMPIFRRGFPPVVQHKPIKNMVGQKNTADIHPHYFTRKSLFACLSKAGFEIKSCSNGHKPYLWVNSVPVENPQSEGEIVTENPIILYCYFLKIGFFDMFFRKFIEGTTRFLLNFRNI